MLKQKSEKALVMVVDDEEGVRKLARRALELAGFRVIEARDGMEALALIDDAAPVDLLCADMNMPNLSGDEMARQFRLRQPDLKVLYVSGYVDELFEKRHTLWQGEAFLEAVHVEGPAASRVPVALRTNRPAPVRSTRVNWAARPASRRSPRGIDRVEP